MKRVFLGLLLFVMLFIVSACTGRDGYGFKYIVHTQSKCQKMNTPISEADTMGRLFFSFTDHLTLRVRFPFAGSVISELLEDKNTW